MRYNMGGRGASSNQNSRMDFTFKKDIQTMNGDIIPKGTKVTKVIELAGGKTGKQIKDIKRITETYGGKEKDWSKRRGTIVVDGREREIHYYQNNRIGKVEVKFK